jgi:NADPH-dependent 2,4-dienoyl-CoA reductase/sulfur reductase-like enzyme
LPLAADMLVAISSRYASVRLVIGDVRRIDRDARQIAMADGMIVLYDTLVIATGARLAPEAVLGYAEARTISIALRPRCACTPPCATSRVGGRRRRGYPL